MNHGLPLSSPPVPLVDQRPRRLLERLPLLTDRPIAAYMLAVGLSVGACVLRMASDHLLPPGFPYLTFFPAVIICAFLLGRGPGTLAAVLCGLMAWYFFIPPINSFALGVDTAVALLFYAGVVTVDIMLVDWMQTANHRLRDERERNADLALRSTQLAERTEILFGELQHRVSNNLQMIGAVLSLQKRGVTDPAAIQALDNAATRLTLIGRIQRQLYDTSGSQIALHQFLRDLAADVIEAGGKPGIAHSVSAPEGITLPPDALIPLALILAEAIANAIEHGFATRDDGRIAIDLVEVAGHLHLSVVDDGAGLPPAFDLRTSVSLGSKIATTLARQLGGSFEVLNADPVGAMSILVIPHHDQRAPTR